jgi:hydrogenase nickel incorporation protein HypA/HybF
MHELSIATSIVEAAEAAALEAGASRVTVVSLRIGVLSGVVVDSLRFCFDMATEGTLLEGASLAVDELPAVARCTACDIEVELLEAFALVCPRCGASTPELVQGRELELASLEIVE